MFGLLRKFAPTSFGSSTLNAKLANLDLLGSFNLNQVRHQTNKLKTHKGASKRFLKTSTGHKRGQCGKQHLNFGMSGKQKSNLRGPVAVTKTQSKMLDRMQIR